MPRRAFVLLTLAVVVVLGGGIEASTSNPGPAVRPALAQSSADDRVTFNAGPGGSLLVQGTYPIVQSDCTDPVQPLLHARFPGTIEVGVDTDGTLFVIGVLPFEQYLEGIAEVPRLWPTAALRAQVVAARSYALANMAYPDETGDRLGYDLCATTSCQVYVGMGVSGGPYGDRWVEAVDDTARQVLLYKKKPADALYFSTSNGSTVGNDEVFGTAPLPYLRPVEETDDGASPVRHWKTTIPFTDVSRFLEAAGDRSGAAVKSVTLDGEDVVIKGGKETTTLSVTEFRTDMNYWSHCLDPGSYPGTNESNGSGLPQTIPSKWFTMAEAGSAVVITGEGWGHGVGMVQWGAYGKAKRGVGYKDILASYYGGLKVKTYDEPEVIRIGIAVGLTTVRVEGTGQATASGTDVTTGPWRLDGGNRVHVRTGAPIPQPIPSGEFVHAPATRKVGQKLAVRVSVPETSVVSVVLETPDGDVRAIEPRTLDAGEAKLTGKVPDMPTGNFRLVLVVTDGVDVARTDGPKVLVVGTATTPSPTVSPLAPSSAAPAPSTTPAQALPPSRGGSGWALPAVVLGGGLLLAATVGLVVALRRRAKRREVGSWGGA